MPLEQPPMKGVILAAGFGNRLKPLTQKTPKPLLPFLGKPILYHLLESFLEVGITQVMINAHYLWQEIEKFIKKIDLPMEISLSVEKEKILGTGGAYAMMSNWRQGADVLAMNGDIFHKFNLPLFINKHYQSRNYASMALTPQPLEQETTLWAHNETLLNFGKQTKAEATPHGFACLQILSDSFLKQIPPETSTSIIPFYNKALSQEKSIGAYPDPGFWADIGTPQKYFQSQCLYLKTLSQKIMTKR